MKLRSSVILLAAHWAFASPNADAQVCHPQAFPHPLGPPGAMLDIDYGAAVAIRGSYAVVGAPKAYSNHGAAYVYELVDGDWQLMVEMKLAAGSSGDAFGSAVAIDGTRVFIGAPGANGKASGDGAVYVYSLANLLGTPLWLLEAKLSASNGATGDRFGEAVAADDGVLLVGAPGRDTLSDINVGQVSVYERVNSVWQWKTSLTPTSPLQWEQFGSSVAIDGNYAVIGSPTHGGPVPFPSANGRAFIFERESASVWTVDAQLSPSDSTPQRKFGQSVAIVGTRALVGAPGTTIDSLPTGAAYVFEKPFGAVSWSLQKKLTSPSFSLGAEYGSGVALSLNQAWVAGRPSVFRFEFSNGNWTAASPPSAPFADLEGFSFDDRLGTKLAADGALVLTGRPGGSPLDVEAAFPMHACGGNWTTIGIGISGSGGIPQLRGAGALQEGLALEFRLAMGKPSAPALFTLHGGAAPAGATFAGGLLYTLPIHFSIVVPLNANGELAVPAVLTPGFANANFTAQVLISDPITVSDVVLTNAVEFQIGL